MKKINFDQVSQGILQECNATPKNTKSRSKQPHVITQTKVTVW